ncbi:unnamed protein product [Bursaphelenchus xylophilus]|uniref:(pine wood nematode) hypothetical protein n=1 Tax=Bursaphelenchus xylophilus TaxID=6326 RepID=A0A7I8WMY7_BURXY|nr:unnamed protein product [Bursaphelenchus xylophilus]CAG9092417.1 unnamed protein product [Bursaphelenchus xylophilus]
MLKKIIKYWRLVTSTVKSWLIEKTWRLYNECSKYFKNASPMPSNYTIRRIEDIQIDDIIRHDLAPLPRTLPPMAFYQPPSVDFFYPLEIMLLLVCILLSFFECGQAFVPTRGLQRIW